MELSVLTPSEAFYWMSQIAANGDPAEPRGFHVHEVQHMTCAVTFPHILPVEVLGRNLRPQIAAVEALQLIGQVAQPELVTQQSNAMAAYIDDGIFAGAYGQRVYGQLAACERTLRADKYTRQAVISIYDGRQDLLTWNGERPMLDIPCTLTLQFMFAKGRLILRTSMRSNDVWLGLPYDLFQFINLQMAMADALGVECGPYVHTVGNSHVYAKDLDNVLMLKAPSEPESHLTYYARRFNGNSIGEISSRCRSILLGQPIEDPTPWESYLTTSLTVGSKKS